MRVALVNGVCVNRDAISEAVRGTARAMQRKLGAEVRLFAYANEFHDLPFTRVDGVRNMLVDDFFLSADVIVYHFGIYYEMFNALIIGNGRAKQIVRFHNITPKSLLPPSSAALIDKSLEQAASIAHADLVLADSDTNKRDLIRLGVPESNIVVSPLYVKFDTPPKVRRMGLRSSPVQYLYVGRFVKSKGVLDLVDALNELAKSSTLDFRATLAGNLTFSDAAYVAEVKRRIRHYGLDARVSIEGDVSDQRLKELYDAADVFVMPSYHEGFCVPVLEALHAGCVPIAYGAGNLPDLIGDLGVLTPVGDVTELGNAMKDIGVQLQHTHRPPTWRLGARSVSHAVYGRELGTYMRSLTFDAFADRMARSVEGVLQQPATSQTAA